MGTTKPRLEELAEIRALVRSGGARTLREDLGLTLADTAAAVGVGTSTVSRWELGQRIPRGDAALRYCAALRQAQVGAQVGAAMVVAGVQLLGGNAR